MPIPQELFFLVGWASCPSNKFMKTTFARGLLPLSFTGTLRVIRRALPKIQRLQPQELPFF
jgi:hypothetical protein